MIEMNWTVTYRQITNYCPIERMKIVRKIVYRTVGQHRTTDLGSSITDLSNLVTPNRLIEFNEDYFVVPCAPATGILFITKRTPCFISGHLRMRGRNKGRYPYKYLEMIDKVFGCEQNTIEVCSHSITNKEAAFTVDINPDCKPNLVCNGESLEGIIDGQYDRWRCDPPYNQKTAQKMYGTSLPKTYGLLHAGSRILKANSLMFLLLGPQNYQKCPPCVKRIGWVAITVVPNNELRALHIYLKL